MGVLSCIIFLEYVVRRNFNLVNHSALCMVGLFVGWQEKGREERLTEVVLPVLSSLHIEIIVNLFFLLFVLLISKSSGRITSCTPTSSQC